MASIAAGAVQAVALDIGSSMVLTGPGLVQFLTGPNAGQMQTVSGTTVLGPYTKAATLNVTNISTAVLGIDFVATNGRVLAGRNGSIAAPIDNITSSTGRAFVLPAQIVIPAGSIPDNSTLKVTARSKRTNANATALLSAYLGTAGTIADSLLGQVSMNATDGHVGSLDSFAFFSNSLTSFTANGTAAPQSSTGGGTHVDRSTNVNRAATMYVTLAIGTANALDAFALDHYRVVLELGA